MKLPTLLLATTTIAVAQWPFINIFNPNTVDPDPNNVDPDPDYNDPNVFVGTCTVWQTYCGDGTDCGGDGTCTTCCEQEGD
ncbi:unnamed protein product [Cercospora beticola]|nr:unnamed protein product [Cercospora beticola]